MTVNLSIPPHSRPLSNTDIEKPTSGTDQTTPLVAASDHLLLAPLCSWIALPAHQLHDSVQWQTAEKKTTFLVTFPVSASFCSSIWQCAPCRLGTKSHNTSQRRHLGILGFLHVFQKIQCGNRVWHQPCHWILEAARWQDVVWLWCKGDLESLLVSSGNPWPSMSWFQWFQIVVGSRRGWSTS